MALLSSMLAPTTFLGESLPYGQRARGGAAPSSGGGWDKQERQSSELGDGGDSDVPEFARVI
jgi:hypothetical protein